MKKLMLLSLLVLLASGCERERSKAQEPKPLISEREKAEIDKMRWIDGKDPISDARKAIVSGQCVYLAGASRSGVYLPELSADKTEAVKASKQYKVLAGMGDLIVGSLHKKYRAKTKDYMAKYNSLLAEKC